MSSEAAPGQDAAGYCAALVRDQDFDRYAATLFVGTAPRRALLALAAFNVEIVRIPRLVSQPLVGDIRLQWWSDLLDGTAHGGESGNPVAAELLWAIDSYRLPTAPLRRLIEARQFDLYNDPMPDLAVLQDYLDATVGGLLHLGAMLLRPAPGGPQDVDLHAAHAAAMALGIAQLIARLPYDGSRRQLYVPKDLLERHGSSPEEVFAGRQTTAMQAALIELIAVGQSHLAQALQELLAVPRELRPALLPLALARRDLDRLARPERDPFQPEGRSRLATLWALWRASRSPTFR